MLPPHIGVTAPSVAPQVELGLAKQKGRRETEALSRSNSRRLRAAALLEASRSHA